MRKPPIPRAVPHRRPGERWTTVGACGVLALGHATRAAVDAPHAAYLSVLDVLAVAAAIGVVLQLAFVDDELSRLSAGGVAVLLGAANIVGLTVALPGTHETRYPLLSLVMLATSAFVVFEALRALRRPERLRTRQIALPAARARRETAPAPAARRDPERPAA
jgi:peptidoglycan/LPS O-acetylase OafA/YrhL